MRRANGTGQHPGFELAQTISRLNLTKKEFARVVEIPLSTLKGVCAGRQPFPIWLCDELGKKTIGTRLGWLMRIRNYEFYVLEQKWKAVDKEYEDRANLLSQMQNNFQSTTSSPPPKISTNPARP